MGNRALAMGAQTQGGTDIQATADDLVRSSSSATAELTGSLLSRDGTPRQPAHISCTCTSPPA